MPPGSLLDGIALIFSLFLAHIFPRNETIGMLLGLGIPKAYHSGRRAPSMQRLSFTFLWKTSR
jgi:hypothetical protein